MASSPGSRTLGFIASPPAVSRPCGLPFASVISTFPAPSGRPKPHETSALMSIPGEELYITPWGVGEQAVLDYLARYVFRIALTDRRIVGLDDETVSFQYRDRKAGRTRICRVPGHEFLRRYLQHVLPKGFHKVRYFGLWHPSRRSQATRVRHALRLDRPTRPPPRPEPQ